MPSLRQPVELALLVLPWLSLVACGPTATLQILRPAQINAQAYGGTVTVQGFGGDEQAAEAITAGLRRELRSADVGALRYVKQGAGLLIHGSVLDHSFREHLERRSEPCPYARGYNELRTMAPRCFRYYRYGRAHLSVRFDVTSSTGQRVTSETLEDDRTEVTEQERYQPAPIDGGILLAQLREDLTERFVKVLTPWREEVKVRFGRCGPARDRCRQGIEAVRAGEFQRAAQRFRGAVRQLRREGGRRRHLAGATFNLGLALGYSADFEGAERAIRRAIKLAPRRDAYQRELDELSRLKREREELIRQLPRKGR